MPVRANRCGRIRGTSRIVVETRSIARSFMVLCSARRLSGAPGAARGIRTAPGERVSGGFEDEVVGDRVRAVALVLRVEEQLGLDGLGHVVVDVLATGEVELGGDRAVAGSPYQQVQVGRAPRAPAGCPDELAGRAVGRDLVLRWLDRADLEPALVVGDDEAAQVAHGEERGD